jgi:hypothetical protein
MPSEAITLFPQKIALFISVVHLIQHNIFKTIMAIKVLFTRLGAILTGTTLSVPFS